MGLRCGRVAVHAVAGQPFQRFRLWRFQTGEYGVLPAEFVAELAGELKVRVVDLVRAPDVDEADVAAGIAAEEVRNMGAERLPCIGGGFCRPEESERLGAEGDDGGGVVRGEEELSF